MINKHAGQAANDDGTMPPIPSKPGSSSDADTGPAPDLKDSTQAAKKRKQDEPIDISTADDVDIDEANDEEADKNDSGGGSAPPPAP